VNRTKNNDIYHHYRENLIFNCMLLTRLFFITLLAVMACSPKPRKDHTEDAIKNTGTITKTSFGHLPDGQEVFLYTLTNSHGLEMKVTNYGGLITSIKTPDKNGVLEDIVLGYDTLGGYLKESPLFGALVGRYANRIAKARFKLEGKEYTLAANNGPNSIHGGRKGFDKVVWNAEEALSPDGPSLTLTYLSKDMEEGFPGNLKVHVTYTLANSNELEITYQATTDKTTVVNLTQHSYLNLTGNAKRDILDHDLMIPADSIVAIDEMLIPTGQLRRVAGTPLDFTTPHRIGERIDHPDEQLKLGRGYDHCFVLQPSADSLTLAATLSEPVSGRTVTIFTSSPGVQVYSGNFLSGSITGKGGVVYKKRFGICFETGAYPDAPNHRGFPSTILRPGEVYKTTTVFRFAVR
jgi:aldose 1-epimerase